MLKSSDEQRAMNAVEKNKQSVVTVLSSGKVGAGFFVADHLIVTAEHVLDTSDEVNIIPFNSLEVKGKVLKRDFDNDLALIQIDGIGIPVTMNKEIAVGETAIAIGHPFKYENTVTKGIISFVNRSVIGRKGFATQIDMPINSGNSGGPLINLNGEVIGLVRSKMYSYKDGNDEIALDGLGFAARVQDIQDFIKN
jgi:serine protease Do